MVVLLGSCFRCKSHHRTVLHTELQGFLLLLLYQIVTMPYGTKRAGHHRSEVDFESTQSRFLVFEPCDALSAAMDATKTVPTAISEGDESNHTVQSKDDLHFAPRGADIDEAIAAGDISGFDADRMRARASLTADEERKLMRRVDLRIMTLCSLLFLFKNIDSDNISNARIMNRGTDRNIMTQLGLTSDEYNLLTVFYYVSVLKSCECSKSLTINCATGALHYWRSSIKPAAEKGESQHLAVQNHGIMGYCSPMSCARDQQGWDLGDSLSSRIGKSSTQSRETRQPSPRSHARPGRGRHVPGSNLANVLLVSSR